MWLEDMVWQSHSLVNPLVDCATDLSRRGIWSGFFGGDFCDFFSGLGWQDFWVAVPEQADDEFLVGVDFQ